ncbi:MAG: M14-type cytosolic carboxypeptidase [Planctomycetaceae bacterium]|nr:M14-type cytosolic carboxypeptidase [Planctomycetaceae bacterium]
MKKHQTLSLLFAILFSTSVYLSANETSPIRFNTAFPGGCLGKIAALEEPDSFRCFIPGQYNENGRNRQTSWFYFRIENVKNRSVKLIMTDYIGEYNLRPGAVPMHERIQPVCSEDGKTWKHIETMIWDKENKELTLNLCPAADKLWIAHVQPYTFGPILEFIKEAGASPFVSTEIFGETVLKRPLHLLTITDTKIPDDKKKRVFLMGRQHAWEAPTTFMCEGAVRFLISNDPKAVEIRQKAVVYVVLTLDPDGCELGGVRFNRNGYDLNRHWNTVNPQSKDDMQNMPEVFHAYNKIQSLHEKKPLDILVSLHNQETGDCLMTAVDGDEPKEMVQRFEKYLSEKTFFDSVNPKMPIRYYAPDKADTISALWKRLQVPSVTIEIRVERHPKLDKFATSEDYIGFGAGLIQAMFDVL